MRLAARLVIGVLVVLALTAAALFLLRRPIAEAAVERVMARARLIEPAVVVESVSLDRLTLASMKAGTDAASAIDLSAVEFAYDWRDLLFKGDLRTVSIGGGRISARIDETWRPSIAGWSPDPEAPPSPPPFEAVKISGVQIDAATPAGLATSEFNGAFDINAGGRFAARFKAENAGNAALAVSDAAGSGEIALGSNGEIAATAAATGDIRSVVGAISGADLRVEATLASWRSFFGSEPKGLEGAASIAVKSSTLDAESSPTLAPLISASGEEIGRIMISGDFIAEFSRSSVRLRLAEGPLAFISDRDDRLLIGGDGGPLFERAGGETKVRFVAALSGPAASGDARFSARSVDSGKWAVEGEAQFEKQTIAGFAFADFKGAFDGVYSRNDLSGDATVDVVLQSGQIGRMRVSDLPINGDLRINADLQGQSIVASPPDGACLNAARGTFRFVDQDMDAKIADAALCAKTSPLISIGWSRTPLTELDGVLNSRSAFFRIGKTTFAGAPPALDFTLAYDSDKQTSRIRGRMTGGAVILNDALILSGVDGGFDSELVRDTVAVNAAISSVRIAEKTELEKVAPVIASGGVRLADNVASFTLGVSTPDGARLGAGDGVHYVKTGRGEAVFDSGLLRFTYGFQPDRLLPALRGVVSNASGTTEGRAKFSWAPDSVLSSATINLDNVSFSGPGVAVTRTEGVSGKLVFSNLAPVATAGEQLLAIRKIDLDALKLENGAMKFQFPGDDTIEIIEAEFPWFDGTIGAYDSRMSIAGGTAETQLKIDNVNLQRLLSYLNIEGLSGEGVVEGVLPVSFEGGRARVNNGLLSSKGKGVVRYQGKATQAAAQSSEQSALAFEILRELRFDKLSAEIDGPLDGTLNFKIFFEGRSDIPVKTGKETQRVDSPVKYRITIDAPLLSLIEQAILSTDVKLQIERAQKEEKADTQDQ